VITSILRKMQPQRPHLTVLVVLLLCSFGLTGVVAYQAYRASRGEQAAALAALRGYARDFGDNYRRNLETVAIAVLRDAFEPVRSRAALGTVSADTVLSAFLEAAVCDDCGDSTIVRSAFHYDFAKRALDVAGGPVFPGIDEWLAGQMSEQADFADNRWGFAIATSAAPERRTVLILLDQPVDQGARHVYGVEVDSVALTRMAAFSWSESQQTQRAPLDSLARPETLVSVRVVLPDGSPIFASTPQYAPEHSASTQVRANGLLGMVLNVALNPEMEDAFVLMPRERLPALLALLIITGALTLVGIGMIRREAEITRLRSDFIAGVSHELRTPLAQIRMFAETLMMGRVRTEGERQRSLEIIDQEARRLAHLVENVLLFARSERRRARINPELTDLEAHLRETIQGFAVLCRTRDIELRPELQEGVVAPVDQGALRQILLNLLDNAVKYGPLRQRITIGLALMEDVARIWVDDQGPGIPDSQRNEVFQSFFRLGRDIDSAVAGSGIGLAIVRELAMLHGGRAWADDAPGGGARLVVELPGAYLRPELAAGGWAVA
jgi:signal transduction histidine kinase